MKTPKVPFTELLLVSERPSFLAEARQALNLEGVAVGSTEAPPRPSGLTACLADLEAHKGGILLIDAQGDAPAALLLSQAIFDRRPTARVFLAGSGGDPELILRALRTGASEFLPLPLERRTVWEAIQRVWRRTAPELPDTSQRRGRVFAFLGSKGGCGTTTLAANLAVTLAGRGRSTILVDLDLSAGDVALMLNLNTPFTVADVVQNAHRLDRDLLNGMMVRHLSGLQVLAAGEDRERSADVDPVKIGQILGFLREQFDCVVVNTGGSDDAVRQTVLNQADLVHLVSSLDFLALRRAQWALRRLLHAGLSPDMIRLVVNRYEKTPYVSLEEAETALDMKVAWTVPLDARGAQEALNDGIPLVTRSRNGVLSCFEKYAADLFPGESTGAPAIPRRGLFGLFSSRAASHVPEGGVSA
jgi:pilus assembly protein CpaE